MGYLKRGFVFVDAQMLKTQEDIKVPNRHLILSNISQGDEGHFTYTGGSDVENSQSKLDYRVFSVLDDRS